MNMGWGIFGPKTLLVVGRSDEPSLDFGRRPGLSGKVNSDSKTGKIKVEKEGCENIN